LAARLLALTSAEAAVTPAVRDVKPQPKGQHDKRFLSAADFLYLAFVMGSLGLAFLWLIACYHIRSVVRFSCSTRPCRAPPLLQLA
jgi:cell division protein FtsX